MPAPKIHTLYAVDAGGTLISGITDQAVNPQAQELLIGGDGATEPQLATVMGAAPQVDFSTVSLASALTAVGLAGLNLTTNPAVFFWQQCADGGLRAGALSHLKASMAKGLLLPVRLTARQGDAAELQITALAKWDGTNDPIVLTANQSLTGSPNMGELFTLGPVAVNGSAVPGVVEVSIDFAISLYAPRADGDLYPRFIGIKGRQPVVRVRSLELLTQSTFGLTGAATTTWATYFRKKSTTGNVADATAQHVKVSGTNGRAHVESARARHGDDGAQTELVIQPTTLPTLNTATAIV